MSNTLVLVRHGESEWNKLNLFTGWKDVDLSEKGVAEAKKAGQLLKAEHLKFDIAYTSALKRAQRTLTLILEELGQTKLETHKDQALNERDYGDLAGLNKDDARARWGEEQVHLWRRSYDVPPPGGESLKDTGARVWPVARLDEATAALRAEVGVGPTRDAPGPDGARSLAALPAGAALALAVVLALRTTRRPRVRSPETVAARTAAVEARRHRRR